jgi:hypothetical protein
LSLSKKNGNNLRVVFGNSCPECGFNMQKSLNLKRLPLPKRYKYNPSKEI